MTDEKAKALARLKVVKALLAEVYQEFDNALRQLELSDTKICNSPETPKDND